MYRKFIPDISSDHKHFSQYVRHFEAALKNIKSKEKEILVEVNEEEKISLEDELLQNATCQHTITFNKIMMYRNKDPSAFSLYVFYRFMKRISGTRS